MGQGARYTSTKTDSDQVRTPDHLAKSHKARRAVAQSVTSALSNPPSSASASVSTPSTTSTSKSKSKKRASISDQPTLTQIDFVTVSQQPSSDDDSQFEYIGNSGQDTREVIEIEGPDEGQSEGKERNDEQDEEYKPTSASRIKRERGVKFDTALSRSKGSLTKTEKPPGKGRRKSGDPKNKEKEDKTLTQMKYVRRINIESEDDNDVKLEYAYITPKKKDLERQTSYGHKVKDAQDQPTYISDISSQHKRRKLSQSPAGMKLCDADSAPEKKEMPPPTTPQKSFRHEIPSSQSPESPGVAFITSSQFRSATRSPPKWNPPTCSHKSHVKEELTTPPKLENTPGNMQTLHIDEKPPQDTRDLFRLPQHQQETAEFTPDTKASVNVASNTANEPSNPKNSFNYAQRTVVYETDAESEYSELEDSPPDAPSEGQSTTNSYHEDYIDDEPKYPKDEPESQELPPPPVPETQVDLGSNPSQMNLLSDASICYQRVHPDTQFPLDPVPTINTQRMTELFPEYSNGLHTLTPSPPSSPGKIRPHPSPTPQVVTETQRESQTPNQYISQNTHKMPTDVVPESSPVGHCHDEDTASMGQHASATKDVVVQVESSQPVDRPRTGQDSGPQRMLSRSQILTSSVMESIPVPAFWMSSQDSVGEPYSQPKA